MASLLWNYNPISLTYYGLSNITSYFLSENLKIIKPNDLSKYDCFIVNMNNVLFNNDLEPICNSINSFNKLFQNNDNIAILSINNNLSNRKIKKLLHNNKFNCNSKVNYLSSSNLSIFYIEDILNNYCEKNKEKKLIKKYKYHKKKVNNLAINLYKVKIGIIGTNYYFELVNKKIKDKYVNVDCYNINNEINHDFDLIIVGKIDYDYSKNNLIDKIISWSGKKKIINTSNILFTYEINVNYENSSSFVFNKILNDNNVTLKVDNKFKLDDKYFINKLFIYFGSNIKILNITNDLLLNDANIDRNLKIKVDNCLCVNNDVDILNKLKNDDLKNKITYVIPDISYLSNSILN